MQEFVILGTVAGAVGFGLWLRRAISSGPAATAHLPRELPAPETEARLRQSVGALPAPLVLDVRRLEGPYSISTRLAVSGVAPELTLRTAAVRREAGLDTGDAAIDRRFHVNGPVPLVRALMDQQARRGLAALQRVEVSAGRLVTDVPVVDGVVAGLEPVARRAVEVARHLLAPEDVPLRLAANVRGDDNPRVRLYNLQALRREFPDHPAARNAAHVAATDAVPEVRLEAAIALGERGHAVLRALVAGPGIDDACSAAAIDALGTIPDATASEVLAVAATPAADRRGPARPLTARACIDALARAADPQGIPLLARVLESSHPSLALAAVKALAHIGTAAAVLPLQEAASRHDDEVQRAALRAVADIQAELSGARGQVSLSAGVNAGALALSDDASGRVSPVKRHD